MDVADKKAAQVDSWRILSAIPSPIYSLLVAVDHVIR